MLFPLGYVILYRANVGVDLVTLSKLKKRKREMTCYFLVNFIKNNYLVHSDCEPHKFMKLFGKYILAAHIFNRNSPVWDSML